MNRVPFSPSYPLRPGHAGIPSLLAAFALLCTACDRTESPLVSDAPSATVDEASFRPESQQDDKGRAFAAEMSGLKSRGLDPVATAEAVRALRERFGYSVNAHGMTSPHAAPEAEALGKAAAIGSKWKLMKSFDFTFPTAIKTSFVVTNLGTLHAWTALSAAEQGVDPVLIAYTRTSGTSASKAYTVKVLAYVDDISGTNLNSEIVWTNNTGANVTVELLAFVYSEANAGTIKLSERHSIIPVTNTFTTQVSAGPMWNNSVAGGMAGCSGPWKSRITLTRVAGGGYGHGILGINFNSMVGGAVYESTATQETALIPTGNYNMLLGFVPWDLTLSTDGSKYSAKQEDRYDCFN